MDRPRDLVRRDSDGQTFIIPASQLAGPDDPTPWPRQFTLIARSVMAIMELVTIGYLGYYTHIMRNHGRDARPGLGFVGVILALINDVLVTYVATVQRYTAQRNCYATMIDILSASLACGGAAIVGWVVSVPSDPWFEQHNTAGNLLMGVYGAHFMAVFGGLIVCCGCCARGSGEGEKSNDVELGTANPAWSGAAGAPDTGGAETEPLHAGPSAPGVSYSSEDWQNETKKKRQSVASADKVFHIDAPREISGASRPSN